MSDEHGTLYDPEAEEAAPPDPRQAGLGLDNPNEARVPIASAMLKRDIGILAGLRTAEQTLKEAEHAKDLAGMKIAIGLVSAEASAMQQHVWMRAMRMAAQAGVDLGRFEVVTFERGETIVCKPYRDKLTE